MEMEVLAPVSLYRSIFQGLILLSTAASAIVLWLSARAKRTATTTTTAPTTMAASSIFRHPLTLFAIVCLLIFINQIAFNAYVLRVHGGNPWFVGRYLPRGWFDLSRGPVVRFVAANIGDAKILAPSVLNVQAFLELPFVITAYLSVARLLGGRVYGVLTRLPVLLLASWSFTITFCLVELSVPNPWTSSDIVIRAIAGGTVPLLMAWIARHADRNSQSAANRPTTAIGLFAFLIGSASMAYAVLAIYDSFLLYNFGHLDGYVPGLVLSAVLLVGVTWAIPRLVKKDETSLSSSSSSLVGACARDALATFTVVFFVPSLVLRYQGYRPTALACGILLVVFAFAIGVRRAVKRSKATLGGTLSLAFCSGVGISTGLLAVLLVALLRGMSRGGGGGEDDLALVSTVFLATTIAAARAVELILPRRRLAFGVQR